MNISRLLFGALAVVSFGAYAGYPSGYYDSLSGKTGLQLMQAAKSVVSRHTVVSYGDNTWDAFRTTDVKEVNGREAWWDMYSNDIVYVSEGHPGMNIEHSVANSWWGKTKNDAYKDLFHLNPSEADANNRKANYPLGEISGNPSWTNGVTSVGTPVSGQGGGSSRVYEPLDRYKGDFARAFMYVFTVYDNISWKENTAWMYSTTDPLMFKQWARDLLIKWNDNDPVDEKELNRQEAIYKIQKNRNPYIDLPTLCHYIWGEKSGTAFNPDGGEDPTPPIPVEPGDEGVLLDMDFETETSISAVESKGWCNDVVSGSLNGWYVTDFSNNHYAAASAYKGTASGGPYEYWLVTPALQTKADATMTLTFRTQGAYGVPTTSLGVYMMTTSDPRTAELTELDATVCTPNAVGMKPVYSDWVQSGNVEIPHGGKPVYVGFKYLSDKGGSDNSATYCVDDIRVITDASGAVGSPESEENLYIVVSDAGGIRVLSPSAIENLYVYDLSGRVVAYVDALSGSEFIPLVRGVYIVKADGRESVKIAVR